MLNNLGRIFSVTACLTGTPLLAERDTNHTCNTPELRGEASYYNPESSSNLTASGEPFTGREMTAAHRDLLFGSIVRVTDIDTGNSVDVRINDYGPNERLAERVIDLSERAAKELGMGGEANVTLQVLSCG